MILWRWLRVLAGLLAVSIFVGLPYPGAFLAADDDDEILLKREFRRFASVRQQEQGWRVPGLRRTVLDSAPPARNPGL